MNYTLTVITLTGIVLLAVLLFLAVKPKLSIRISGIFSVIAAIGGIFFYGYGFAAAQPSNLFLDAVRTLLCVIGMFIGSIDFDSVSQAPLFQLPWMEISFYLLHLMAFYATVSAALSTFGAGLLQRIRPLFALWEDLHLIYGIDDKSLTFGRELSKNNGGYLVFIDESPEDAFQNTIKEIGAIVRSDAHAVAGDVRFLRSILIARRKRNLCLYALSSDTQRNLEYAKNLLSSIQARGIAPEQTSLVIHSREDSPVSALQALDNRYGYGFVTVFQEPELAARILIREYPPCNTLTFDEQGKAEQDFEVLLVGFGRIGQAVLKNLIMNGQFEGSRFHATVVSPDCEAVRGSFSNISDSLLNNYHIQFLSCDARSPQMYEYLRQDGKKLRYLVLCTGNVKRNQEIAEELAVYFERHNLSIPIFQCSYQGVTACITSEKSAKQHNLYHPEILNARNLDELAMVINHFYMGSSGTTPLDDWMHCDYFSRMSCRASADFMDAMLKMAGKTEQEVLSQGWELTEAQKTNLSITEHLRWCAFHFCMGFSPMSQEEYEERAQRYLQQKAAGLPTLRIGKNMTDRTHACLIPWEQLDKLSEKEQSITGKAVDYKAMDLSNVLAVPKMLSIRQKLKE